MAAMAELVHETVLDNGLRVLIKEVHTAPLASVWCWYRVGSKDEPSGQTGVFNGKHYVTPDGRRGAGNHIRALIHAGAVSGDATRCAANRDTSTWLKRRRSTATLFRLSTA
jgi:hypothetical protein